MRSIYRWFGAGILTALAFVGSDGKVEEKNKENYVQRTIQTIVDNIKSNGSPKTFNLGNGKRIITTLEEDSGKRSLALDPSYTSPITDPNSDGYIDQDEFSQNGAITVEEANRRYLDIVDDVVELMDIEKTNRDVMEELKKDVWERGGTKKIRNGHLFENNSYLSWAMGYTPFLRTKEISSVKKVYLFDNYLIEVLIGSIGNAPIEDPHMGDNLTFGMGGNWSFGLIMESIDSKGRVDSLLDDDNSAWNLRERQLLGNLIKRLRDPNKKSKIENGVEDFD
ncbi:MAG TPA: hypothetical protein VJA47_03275 [archaeon]|nr:hypothetical protein [archaeon]